MYFGKLYYAGIFPFLTNKKKIKIKIKSRSNIFKIDSVVSTKLSPDSSSIELLGRDFIHFVEIDDDPVLSLCLISTTSTLLDKFGILQYLSNNSSNELLMIGIALVKNSAKPTIFGTGDCDSDEPLKSSSFNCLCSPLSKCSSFKTRVPPRRNKQY